VMRYIAFASDYDGTLAWGGRVSRGTIKALEDLKASGRKLLLVTGRHLADLQSVFSEIALFDRVVAENGALLFNPATQEQRTLAEGPRADFLQGLRDANVHFDVGRVIISSWTPQQTTILEVIRRFALDYQVIFNKDAVMVLPSGINKATGLRAALKDLHLSVHNTVAIGDAENDHSFLSASECGVAVANALPSVKDRADIVTTGDHGQGVIELITHLLQDDLKLYDDRVERSTVPMGKVEGTEKEIRIVPNRESLLVAGPSASGKSTAVGGILEELNDRGYQFCLIDPEGDFESFAGALTIGSPTERADPAAVAKALESPKSLVVNLMGVPLRERPSAFAALLPRILEIRGKTGRPHWLVIDEAHHLMPALWSPDSSTMPLEMGGTILITVHPEHVSAAALAWVNTVLVTGNSASQTLLEFAKAAHVAPPDGMPSQLEAGQAVVWRPRTQQHPVLIKTRIAKSERRRHRRNYAEGELSPEQSFYFRGPEAKLNLRAQNLMTFLQLADGIDDDTWLFHLRQGDYSRWFRDMIKDEELAARARAIESDGHDVSESRARLRKEIESLYTAPA